MEPSGGSVARIVQLFASGLLLAFVACCVASAALQIVAWSRHRREGAPVSFSAVWKPEGYFDSTGLYQMRLAKSLLIVAGVAYLSYGLVLVVASRMVGQGG